MDNPHGTRRTVVATLVALPAVIAFPIRADATERRWRALIEEVSRDHANGRAAALVAYSFRAQIDPATLVQVVGYEHRRDPDDYPRLQFGRWRDGVVHLVNPKEAWTYGRVERGTGPDLTEMLRPWLGEPR